MELPKRIYLQAFGEDPPSDEFVCDEDVTWSATRIYPSDPCYIRAGKDAARIEQLEAVEKAAYRIELWFGEAFDKINLGHYKADVHSMFSDLTAARKALKGGE